MVNSVNMHIYLYQFVIQKKNFQMSLVHVKFYKYSFYFYNVFVRASYAVVSFQLTEKLLKMARSM